MSLRTRLTLSYTGFFTAALLLLGFGIFTAVKQVLYQGVESDLHAGTQQVVTIYRAAGASSINPMLNSDGTLSFQPSGEFTRIFSNPMLIAQVWSVDGTLLGRSPNLRTHELPLPDAALNLRPGEEMLTAQTVRGASLQTLITPLVAGRSLPDGQFVDPRLIGFLQISRPLYDIEHTLALLLSILLGGGAIALLMTASGVFVLSRAALAPIDQVTRTAQSIVRAEDLGQRVPAPRSQDELQRLTVTINELLGRLEALFVTQRRFVADVSHELRTPLAAMQGNLEVLARGAHTDPALLDESLADMRREMTRLIRMVNDLLLLAQSDAGVQIRQEPVELDTLLLEVHRELRPLAGEVALRIGAEDQIVVMGDRDRLKQSLLNLGVNALQHTAAGGSVTLSLERRDGFACLSVADTGAGIAAEDLPHIFERFYRADRSRTRHGGGAGLGLAIVKRIADAHNGHVTVASLAGRGSTFALWLPLEPAPNPQPTATRPLLEPSLAAPGER